MSKRLCRRLGAGVAGAVAFLALATTTAHAANTVELGEEAELVAKGAAVVVPVEVTCDETFFFPSVSVSVTQRHGNRIASGSGYSSDFVCDGTTQIVSVLVTAQEVPFHNGIALATATGPCSFSECARDQEEVRIVKDRA
jgi:hypothetical protein